ncbi:ABC transporter substrate-binding protein [Ketogulonicigenium vulgare]|uniref:ABC transporter, periplasmic substrate-binding protein n=1 Tax=Ketogulonicigenium vulgare (strain WSH-001) TaxID=759362 RepID=F9Y6K6_KETVW|nr:ABC transporter substrate-binding protein [Ketogulonicigenium vulgare]ADO43868.1 extracellular solute-binding protein [Ketogulonicigenium vulgare Y25]AEM42126.1 ABC transporter, periplasmic substrate-binding protein [Ketogulonicigenium vulgare WSH-001]ALJ79751.1 ABC transporter substrate-binding protein [Ketogulonicigenium vulgare]ANW32673.1 ABC transporter substrate-binding protein [Ketogulonicigenium vulgare]AOZ55902.1 extracellular solute-binding protein [Ketogulonicigenium vulgare]
MMTTFVRASTAAAAIFAAQAAIADVTVYTAGPAALIEQLAEGFKAETGINIEFFQATTGQVMARIEAEAANPVVDVLISASWDTATDFTERGWLLPYTSPNAASVPDFLKTDTAVAQGVSALAIAWNPNSGTPRPTEWSDLTGADFNNLVTLPDPAQSGATFELVAALASSQGWDLFNGLAANDAIVAGANAEALNPVLQGAKAAVFGAVDYISLNGQAKGESIEVIFPASGTVIAPRPVMIMEWSQNQDDAKAFVDYILSDAGQAIVAGQNLMPARSDVAANRPLIADLTILPIDAAAVYASRGETLATFAETFAQ